MLYLANVRWDSAIGNGVLDSYSVASSTGDNTHCMISCPKKLYDYGCKYCSVAVILQYLA